MISLFTEYPANVDAPSTDYPWGGPRNVSSPSDGTGTPWEELIVKDIFGFFQAVADQAGLTPSSNPETAVTSQILEGLRKLTTIPGQVVHAALNDDPAVLGLRLLDLDGSGVLIADYPELAASTYVGDANNATAPAFYKSTDAAGVTRSTSGTYLKLPSVQGSFVRATDPTGTADPDGGARDQGEYQSWAVQKHPHLIDALDIAGAPISPTSGYGTLGWTFYNNVDVTAGSQAIRMAEMFQQAGGTYTYSIASMERMGSGITTEYPNAVGIVSDNETRSRNHSFSVFIGY